MLFPLISGLTFAPGLIEKRIGATCSGLTSPYLSLFL